MHGRHAALHPPLVSAHGVGADAEDRGPLVRRQPPDGAGRVVPIHDRHVDVHQDGVVRDHRALCHPDALLPILRLVDGPVLEMDLHEPAVDSVVVHNQQPHSGGSRGPGLRCRGRLPQHREEARRLHGLGQVAPGLNVVGAAALGPQPHIQERRADGGVVLRLTAARRVLDRQDWGGVGAKRLPVPLLAPEPLQLQGDCLAAAASDAVHLPGRQFQAFGQWMVGVHRDHHRHGGPPATAIAGDGEATPHALRPVLGHGKPQPHPMG